jgi:hypothetical protein
VGNNFNKFKTGQLVECQYDFHSYYSYGGGYTLGPERLSFYGIVISYDKCPTYDGFLGYPYFYGPFYEILCTDGKIRYFNEEEIKLFMSEEEE